MENAYLMQFAIRSGDMKLLFDLLSFPPFQDMAPYAQMYANSVGMGQMAQRVIGSLTEM